MDKIEMSEFWNFKKQKNPTLKDDYYKKQDLQKMQVGFEWSIKTTL